MCPPPSRRGEDAAQEPSLRANGSRECAPDDRLREAIHGRSTKEWIASVASLLAMTANTMGSLSSDPQDAAVMRRWHDDGSSGNSLNRTDMAWGGSRTRRNRLKP